MPAQTVKISEANVSKAIRDLLAAKKIMVFRMNAGNQYGVYKKKSGELSAWVKRGHEPGTADLLAMVHLHFIACPPSSIRPIPIPLWIEVKAPGKKQSADQIEFQREVEAYGMNYLLVDNIDTLVDWLKARGL
jgi:hypothetical protein